MNGLNLQADYVTTDIVDSLNDHYYGENELLISGSMSIEADKTIARGNVVDSLIERITYGDSSDGMDNFTAKEILEAITKAIAIVHESDLITDDEDDDRSVCVRLHW